LAVNKFLSFGDRKQILRDCCLKFFTINFMVRHWQ